MQISALLTGLALAASTVAQSSTGQACPANSVSRFEACLCPYGTDFQYSTTWATLGVNAKDFSKYTSSCTFPHPPYTKALFAFQRVTYTGSGSLQPRLDRSHEPDAQRSR